MGIPVKNRFPVDNYDIWRQNVPFSKNDISFTCLHLTTTNRYIYCERDINTRPQISKPEVYYDEQQFVSTAIKKWVNVNEKKATKMLPKLLNEVNRKWNLKRDKVFLYPDLYKNCGHVSLTVDKTITTDIRFERIQILKVNGYQPIIKIPQGVKSDRFLPKKVENTKHKIAEITESLSINTLKEKHQYPTVSDDMIAQELAQQKNINIVISRSGLRTLMDGYSSSQLSDWILPFCVKDITCTDGTKKPVLFVDKALPRPCMSKIELKNWHGKSATNSFMEFNEVLNDDIECLEKSESERALKVEHEEEHSRTNSRLKLEIGSYSTNHDHPVKIKKKDIENTNIVKTSYSYELWKLESFSVKNVYLKNAKKDFNIIVRNKQPGKSLTESHDYCISSKLEYQPEFGGEQMSMSQLIREWVSLLLNPEGRLLRVRADGNTLNYISHDIYDIISMEKNIKHIYNEMVRSRLGLLHNVLNQMADLPRGQYLLHHGFNNGIFAYVFKATESEGNFNLHEYFSELKIREENLPWIPIDSALITPTFRKTQYQSVKSLKRKKKNKKNGRKKQKK